MNTRTELMIDLLTSLYQNCEDTTLKTAATTLIFAHDLKPSEILNIINENKDIILSKIDFEEKYKDLIRNKLKNDPDFVDRLNTLAGQNLGLRQPLYWLKYGVAMYKAQPELRDFLKADNTFYDLLAKNMIENKIVFNSVLYQLIDHKGKQLLNYKGINTEHIFDKLIIKLKSENLNKDGIVKAFTNFDKSIIRIDKNGECFQWFLGKVMPLRELYFVLTQDKLDFDEPDYANKNNPEMESNFIKNTYIDWCLKTKRDLEATNGFNITHIKLYEMLSNKEKPTQSTDNIHSFVSNLVKEDKPKSKQKLK